MRFSPVPVLRATRRSSERRARQCRFLRALRKTLISLGWNGDTMRAFTRAPLVRFPPLRCRASSALYTAYLNRVHYAPLYARGPTYTRHFARDAFLFLRREILVDSSASPRIRVHTHTRIHVYACANDGSCRLAFVTPANRGDL